MRHLIKKYGFHLILTAVVAIMVIVNYKRGTYLTGWDSLQTELNPALAVKRALFSVWEEYQSFGLVSGMAHAADLVRALFLWVISFVVPQSMVRYIFHFFMLLVGAFGSFELLKYAGFHGRKSIYACVGALFYMLNFGVIQLFYLPFEPFSIFFGMLPWELWIFLKVLEFPHKSAIQEAHTPLPRHIYSRRRHERTLMGVFVLINILATPQAYVQTLFVVYGIVLAVVSVATALQRRSGKLLGRAIMLGLIILLINLFWLLPQIYFLKTSGTVVTQAKINQLMNEDVYYQNKERGTLSDFLTMRGYYTGLNDSTGTPLFTPWKDYFDHPETSFIPYLASVVIVIGLFAAGSYRLSFLGLYLLSALTLMSATPPFSFVNELLRHNEVINQIFRSPFTKFIVPYALVSSYLFVNGLWMIERGLSRFVMPVHMARTTLTTIGCVLIIVASWPALSGNFISDRMKVAIPSDYLALMEYFRGQDTNSRIALLPEYTFWGWYVNKWGYMGSGFLWYGIEQPIVSRNFDYWSNKSESYFWELKRASDNKDLPALEQLLEKYDIDYLVLDYSLNPVIGDQTRLQYDTIRSLLASSNKVSLVRKWSNLSVYKIDHAAPIHSFVTASTPLPNTGPAVTVTNEDTAYRENGIYKTDPSTAYDLYYPFLDLTTQTHVAAKQWEFHEDKGYMYLTANTAFDTVGYTVRKKQTHDEIVFDTSERINADKDIVRAVATGNKVVAYFVKQGIYDFTPEQATVLNCTQNGDNQTVKASHALTVTSTDNAVGCFNYYLLPRSENYGYIAKIQTKNTAGRRLFFYILNNQTLSSHVEDRLQSDTQYYFAPPFPTGSTGYRLTFNNNSYQGIPATNTLKGLTVYALPFDELKSITLERPEYAARTVAFTDVTAVKNAYYSYTVTPADAPYNTIILYQEYHEGWNAYAVQNRGFLSTYMPFLVGTKVGTHVSVNNWANGWEINKNQIGSNYVIVLLFWPQYLEFAGLLILGLYLTTFIKIKIG